jgi:hypothetical protein
MSKSKEKKRRKERAKARKSQPPLFPPRQNEEDLNLM